MLASYVSGTWTLVRAPLPYPDASTASIHSAGVPVWAPWTAGGINEVISESGGGGGSGSATVVNGGNLGSTYTLALGSSPLVQFTGTLVANCALTVSGAVAGCSVIMLLQQDATGGRTLSING